MLRVKVNYQDSCSVPFMLDCVESKSYSQIQSSERPGTTHLHLPGGPAHQKDQYLCNDKHTRTQFETKNNHD